MVINGNRLLAAAPIADMFYGKHKAHGVSYGLSEAGYDIRIKQEIRFDRDYRGDRHVMMIERNTLGQVQSYIKTEGRFTLASAIEEFRLPDHMIGIVHDKSTWARRGLSVFNTVIESGWKGYLTLELVYHGSDILIIPAGAGIAQVIFHQITESASYTGKYQDQANEPVAAIASV